MLSGPIVPPVSLPVAVRRDPINHRVEPWLPHAGVKYLQSSWSKGKFKGGRKFEILSRRRYVLLGRAVYVSMINELTSWSGGGP